MMNGTYEELEEALDGNRASPQARAIMVTMPRLSLVILRRRGLALLVAVLWARRYRTTYAVIYHPMVW